MSLVALILLLTPQGINLITAQSSYTSDPADPSIRIVGEHSNGTVVGFVQILRGTEWSNVCDHGWGENDAKTICGQLGYDRGVDFHVRAIDLQEKALETFPMWREEVQCVGNEGSIQACPTSRLSAKCEPAPVSCDTATPQIPNGALRLVGGRMDFYGQVEVMYDGLWGTICDRSWDETSAGIVCSMLGYTEGGTAVLRSAFGVGFAVFLDAVRCKGGEEVITQCTVWDFMEHSCRIDRAAGVVCHQDQYSNLTGEVRLSGSDSPNRGYVEISYYGAWGGICNEHWGLSEARVVCRQLGYESGTISNDKTFKYTYSPSWLADVECVGNESALVDCSLPRWQHNQCGYNGHAKVECLSMAAMTHAVTDDTLIGIYTIGAVLAFLVLIAIVAVVIFLKKRQNIRQISGNEPNKLVPNLSDTPNRLYRVSNDNPYTINNSYDAIDDRHLSGDYSYIMDDVNVYLELIDDDRPMNDTDLVSRRAHTPLPDLPSGASTGAGNGHGNPQVERSDPPPGDDYLQPVDWDNITAKHDNMRHVGDTFVVSDSRLIPRYLNVPEVRVISNPARAQTATSNEDVYVQPSTRGSSISAYVTAIQTATANKS